MERGVLGLGLGATLLGVTGLMTVFALWPAQIGNGSDTTGLSDLATNTMRAYALTAGGVQIVAACVCWAGSAIIAKLGRIEAAGKAGTPQS